VGLSPVTEIGVSNVLLLLASLYLLVVSCICLSTLEDGTLSFFNGQQWKINISLWQRSPSQESAIIGK